MQQLDLHSYECGYIDCFNEMGLRRVKALAFSRPAEREVRDRLLPFARASCQARGTKWFAEDDPLVTDLFPASACRGKYLILLYREDHILDQYLRLKERKAAQLAEGAYFGGNRSRIAWELGRPCSPIPRRAGAPAAPGQRRKGGSLTIKGSLFH